MSHVEQERLIYMKCMESPGAENISIFQCRAKHRYVLTQWDRETYVNWIIIGSWWRHQMETFSALLALCEGNPIQRWIPLTKASDAKLWCFFDLRLSKWLSKQSICCWFETPSSSLWRHCDVHVLTWHTSQCNADSFSIGHIGTNFKNALTFMWIR